MSQVEIPQPVIGYVKDAVSKVLEEHAPAFLDAGSRHDEWVEEWPEEIYSSILGFVSDKMNGSLLLCCEREFLKKTYPADLPAEAEEQEDRLRDWLGELTNLLVGRIKNHFLNHDVTIALNPPSVAVVPPTILEQYAERNPSGPFWYEYEGQRFCVQFGVDVDDSVDFEFVESIPEYKPGDSVLNLNPVARDAGPAAPSPAPASAPTGSGGGNLGLQTVDIDASGRICLRLDSGLQLNVDPGKVGDGRTLRLGSESIELIPDQGGTCIKAGGLHLFIPKAA